VKQKGYLIAIEGIDGSGKTTLAEGLASKLRQEGSEYSMCVEASG